MKTPKMTTQKATIIKIATRKMALVAARIAEVERVARGIEKVGRVKMRRARAGRVKAGAAKTRVNPMKIAVVMAVAGIFDAAKMKHQMSRVELHKA
jgi:hypothetical protein